MARRGETHASLGADREAVAAHVLDGAAPVVGLADKPGDKRGCGAVIEVRPVPACSNPPWFITAILSDITSASD